MENIKKLDNSIQQLNTLIKQRTSYRYKILSGLLTGVATAIGATVIAGLLIFLLSFLVKQINLSNYPTLQNIMREANLIKVSK